MNVVVLGAVERNTEQDKALVHELMDLAYQTYPNCVFVTMLTERGVGQFVKARCMEKGSDGKFRYRLVTVDVRVYANGLSRSDTESIHIARNATTFELGEVFIYLANADRRGTIEELIKARIKNSGRLCQILLPGDPVALP